MVATAMSVTSCLEDESVEYHQRKAIEEAEKAAKHAKRAEDEAAKAAKEAVRERIENRIENQNKK